MDDGQYKYSGHGKKRGLLFALSEETLQLRTAIGTLVAWTAVGMYGLLPVTEGTLSVPISTKTAGC